MPKKKPTRRRKHAGSVHRAGSKWRTSIMVNGKRVSRTFNTRAEAEEYRIETANTVAVNGRVSDESVGYIIKAWLQHVKSTKADSTHHIYTFSVQPFEILHAAPANMLRPVNLQAVIDGLTGRKAQMAHDKIRQCMRWAVRMRLLVSDPTEGLTRPAHDRETIEVFSLDEIPQILEHAEHLRFEAAIRLALSVGLRGGEVWGLQWDDWDGHTLTIQRQAAEQARGDVTVKPPKRNSYRTIALPDSVVQSLESRNAARMREGLAGNPWVFAGVRGAPVRRSNFSKRVWHPLLESCGLRSRGFHHCRHTAASVLLNSGVPITVVSRMLGHKDAATTLAIYAHLMTDDVERHRNEFDRIFPAEVG